MIGALWVGEPVRPLDIVAMTAILVGVGVLQSGRSVGTVLARLAGNASRSGMSPVLPRTVLFCPFYVVTPIWGLFA